MDAPLPGREGCIFVYKLSILPEKERGIDMSPKKQKPIKLDELTAEEKMKYEIADELGLLDRVLTDGWRSLSSKETGRIGGLLARRRKGMEKK